MHRHSSLPQREQILPTQDRISLRLPSPWKQTFPRERHCVQSLVSRAHLRLFYSQDLADKKGSIYQEGPFYRHGTPISGRHRRRVTVSLFLLTAERWNPNFVGYKMYLRFRSVGRGWVLGCHYADYQYHQRLISDIFIFPEWKANAVNSEFPGISY